MIDPIGELLGAGDPALTWAVRHDILDERVDARSLWTLPEVERICRRQRRDGGWAYPGARVRAELRAAEDYAQLATYKQLLVLVSKYRLDRRHPAIGPAAEFLLGRQTGDGDIRGMYGNQYSPNYTADILGLLIEAGYGDDPRVRRGLDWLLEIRQRDGAWALPLRTVGPKPGGFAAVMKLREPIEPDRARPSSHLITGVVLRALAAHPAYRRRRETQDAALVLVSRFFRPDRYADRRSAAYWTKLTFPFRWTDIVSSLDAVGRIGLTAEDKHVREALTWLRDHQRKDGLWSSGYPVTKDPLVDHWVTFAAARAWKRLRLLEPAHQRHVLAAV
ncbi:MAG TPA: hypothetical protein VFL29_01360 [Candidatus Dormibacteraeota bacterium]|nr:hypothetical protein [Candidatus Dormibacteraeota bacterium]